MLTGRPTFLGLQPFDHPFHFVLGGLGLFAVGLSLYQFQRGKQALL